MTTASPEETPLKFPSEFPIKAFGHSREGFDGLVVAIVRRHAPHLGEGAVASRPSKGGKYTSVTVTIQAQSKAQLDAIYQDLTACPEIVMAL
ncbi:YbeD family protein [Methylomagnum sp.]